MKTKSIKTLWSWIATVLLAWTAGYNPAFAQDQGPTTPGAIPNPGTYQGSMQIQQQQDQQAQQFRDQQSQQFQQNMPHQQQYAAPGAGASGPDLRAIWVKRPLVPPNQNPLFGRWNTHAAPPIGPKDSPLGNIGSVFGSDVAQLTAGMLQSVCDSMFGSAVVEFRPTTLVSVGRDGRERVLTRVEYRGGGDTIAVLPLDPGSFGAAVFDFKGHDKVIAREIGCTMARAGAAPTAQPGQAVAVSAPQAKGAATTAVLVVTTPLRGGHVMILKHDVEVALTNGGLRATPDGSAMKMWGMACANGTGTPACQQGVQAVAHDAVGLAVTDAAGRGQTAPLPAGRYYVFNSVHISSRPMMWNLPVDLKAGANSLTLDQHNLKLVQ